MRLRLVGSASPNIGGIPLSRMLVSSRTTSVLLLALLFVSGLLSGPALTIYGYDDIRTLATQGGLR